MVSLLVVVADDRFHRLRSEPRVVDELFESTLRARMRLNPLQFSRGVTAVVVVAVVVVPVVVVVPE